MMTLKEHVTDLSDCADEVKAASLEARAEFLTGNPSREKEDAEEITEEGVSLEDQSWPPQCPTGGHAMVLSMGSYTCNLCGMHFDPTSKHLRPDRDRRWSCAACGDDICFDCRPIRGTVQPAQQLVVSPPRPSITQGAAPLSSSHQHDARNKSKLEVIRAASHDSASLVGEMVFLAGVSNEPRTLPRGTATESHKPLAPLFQHHPSVRELQDRGLVSSAKSSLPLRQGQV